MSSKLEEELVDTIIKEVRKYNQVLIGKDDPLFSIVTANALVLEKYIETFERMLTKHHTELEDTTENYLARFRQKTEDEFNEAIAQSKNIIAKEALKGVDALNEKIHELKTVPGVTPTSSNLNKIYLLLGGSLIFAAGYIIALVVV